MSKYYKEIAFAPLKTEESDILVALLSSIGYDGFEYLKQQLNAYIPAQNFSEVALANLLESIPFAKYSERTIEEENWNAIWEASFDPVVVDDFVAVRAAFHAPQAGILHDIIITPKMSFGTGHHATTALMIQLMKNLEVPGKRVLDFGTGTGVLAILANKLGARKITAIDNDKWSLENANENFLLNGCENIKLTEATSLLDAETADIVLANINLNVLKENLMHFLTILKSGGEILFSGLLENDQEFFTSLIHGRGFVIKDLREQQGWIAILATLEPTE